MNFLQKNGRGILVCDDDRQRLLAGLPDDGQVHAETEQDDGVLQHFFRHERDAGLRRRLVAPEQRDDHTGEDAEHRTADDRKFLPEQPAGNGHHEAQITTSLVVSWLLHKLMHIPGKISTLVGVGSSICGGSAVAATASVIDADDEEVAQAISVIFFFNMLAAIFFPALGALLGFSTTNGEAFGIFAGTAINDTSSVTAAASTWDSLYGLGSQTLDKAVTVKLTRTLAIIPITLVLAFVRTKRAKTDGTKVDLKKIFPMFILYFLLASVITTICVSTGVSASVFTPLKTLSKFLIVMAMCAVGLNTNIVKLVRTGGKPLIMGFCCWVGIAGMSLLMQHVLGIW